MDIVCVIDDLVCTRRVPGLGNYPLRVVCNAQGVVSVATDAVGTPVGRWAFATTGSAARLAMPDAKVMTDLTLAGIIDHWDEPIPQPFARAAAASVSAAPVGAAAVPEKKAA